MSRTKRKWDHITYALETGQQGLAGFNDIKFVHQSMPGSRLQSIKSQTKIGELLLSSPIFINAMTGGGGDKTLQINRDLAIAARETGIAIALGSQMAALKNQAERKTYEIVRKENPNGIILANLGSEANPKQAQEAIDMVEANGIQIHLNVIQELTMPEGDRDFRGALERITEINNAVNVPVIVKEVGFGMSSETAAKLAAAGIKHIDIGGFGGTNFAAIENRRRSRLLPFFEEWGIPTAASLIESLTAAPKMAVIASGGIQTSLDVVKAISIGAEAAGMAGFLLNILLKEGTGKLIEEISALQEEIAIIMAALGAKEMEDLRRIPVIIGGETYHWLEQRGIDTKAFGTRKC